MARTSTPMTIIDGRKPSWSMKKARTGTRNPPKCMPDIAVAMAKERWRENQLLTMDIMVSQPPSPEPMVMTPRAM